MPVRVRMGGEVQEARIGRRFASIFKNVILCH